MADRQDEWLVTESEAPVRLDRFLAAPGRLGSRSRAAAALERGKIFVNDVPVDLTAASRQLAVGERVRCWADRPGTARRARQATGSLTIVHEDAALIVIDKPPRLLTVPVEGSAESSVRGQLREYLRPRRGVPFVVHRIDRDTSGLVLFAKQAQAQQALKEQFRRREPERVYWAIVYGHPTPAGGVWQDRLLWDEHALIQKETHPDDPRGADAECRYRVLESFERTSLVEVSLVTGKRNQIRIQARLRGHTLVGERRYVYGPDSLRPIAFSRQALHARRLAFRHPDDGRLVSFEAALPGDMSGLLDLLRGRG